MKRFLSLLALSMVLVAGTSQAQPCNFGTYSTDGLETCDPCPMGTYGNASGLTSCSQCSPGTFSSALGATTSSTCQNCPAGRFSGQAAAICSEWISASIARRLSASLAYQRSDGPLNGGTGTLPAWLTLTDHGDGTYSFALRAGTTTGLDRLAIRAAKRHAANRSASRVVAASM